MAHLREALSKRDWRVLVAPEAATLLITSGIDDIAAMAAQDRAKYLGVQTEIVTTQLNLRASFEALATTLAPQRTVVVHDRGVADNAAYMTDQEYRDVLAAAGTDAGAVYDLYDAVVHLRSAAVPSQGYDGGGYTTANNQARTESVQAAAGLDSATLAGWVGHPHVAIVGSQGSFAAKIERVLAAVLGVLGDPEPLEVEAKFVLACAPDLTHPVLAAATRATIEQVYLPDSGQGEQRVRARTVAGVTSYTHTTKRDVADGSRVEVERVIDEKTYRELSRVRAPGTQALRKTRYIFVEGDHRFELDELHEPVTAWLLEAELVAVGDPVHVPAWLPATREVTNDRSWRNRSLAAG